MAQREARARQARFRAGASTLDSATQLLEDNDKENRVEKHVAAGSAEVVAIKRDFFGRVVEVVRPLGETDGNGGRVKREEKKKVWVTYHEGLNNAVRKPISLQEFLSGL